MASIPNEGLPKTPICEPALVLVEPGRIYKWCSCGLTNTEPFCDNTHREIQDKPFRSVKVMFDKPGEVLFCQCKQTKTPPFCDDSHKMLAPGHTQKTG